MNVNFEINDSAVLAAFNQLIASGRNPAPALDNVGQQLVGNIQFGFRNSVSPYGQPWAPLKFRSGKPLLDRGHLRDSVVYQVSGDAVEVGTNRPGARLHQFGGTIVPKNKKMLHFMVGGQPVFVRQVTIPARPFMPLDGLPPTWVEDVLGAIEDTLTDELP